MIRSVVVTALFLMMIGTQPISSQETDTQQKGLEIKTLSVNREKGETLSRVLTIVLTDKHGTQRKRVMSGVKKYYDDTSKSIGTFLYPANIKGTTLLTYDHKSDKEDDQWIYMPAAKNVRRIPANKSSEYFMGTDFTYEDMKEDLALEKYNYTLLRTEELNGKALYVVESIPKNDKILKEIGYSKVIEWIQADSLLPIKTVYYDQDGVEAKHFLARITKTQGIYTYSAIEMSNKKREHKTLFQFDSIVFNQDVPDSMFNKNSISSSESRIANALEQ